MKKIAFVFPGQGAQFTGMSVDFTKKFAVSASVFAEATEQLGFDILQMISDESKSAELNITENTQPAILTASCAILEAIKAEGITPDYVAGLSLGEYTAHVCAGSALFGEVVKLVRKRGKFMQEAVPVGQGGMAAIIGLDRELVEEACREASDVGIIAPANYNCPGQIVISGAIDALNKACELCKAKGAKRALVLPVSAPFHSPMLKPAADNLERELTGYTFSDMKYQLISNVTAREVSAADDIKPLLVKQVTSPVRWWDSMTYLVDLGVDTFIEIGPGKTLTGFMKKISPDVSAYGIATVDEFETVIKEINKEA